MLAQLTARERHHYSRPRIAHADRAPAHKGLKKIEEASTGQRRPWRNTRGADGGDGYRRRKPEADRLPGDVVRRHARRPATRSPSSTSSARGARSIVGNIYKGRVDNVLAGLEAAFVDIGLEKNGFLHVDEIVLPGRRDAAARARLRPRLAPDHRHAQARAGDRRPGRQGPAEDEGRPPLDGSDDRRAATWSTRRYGEGVGVSRRLDDKERERLRKEAAKLELKGGGRDHPHRGPGRQARRPRARAAVPVQARRGAAEARRRDARSGARLPGGGPVGARRPRHLRRRVRARDRR